MLNGFFSSSCRPTVWGHTKTATPGDSAPTASGRNTSQQKLSLRVHGRLNLLNTCTPSGVDHRAAVLAGRLRGRGDQEQQLGKHQAYRESPFESRHRRKRTKKIKKWPFSFTEVGGLQRESKCNLWLRQLLSIL